MYKSLFYYVLFQKESENTKSATNLFLLFNGYNLIVEFLLDAIRFKKL